MANNIRPNIYNLGSIPRLVLSVTDIDGDPITPSEARITIERPDHTLLTVSGGAMTQVGDTLTYQYTPTQEGFHSFEGWVKDTVGREAALTKAFYVKNYVGD